MLISRKYWRCQQFPACGWPVMSHDHESIWFSQPTFGQCHVWLAVDVCIPSSRACCSGKWCAVSAWMASDTGSAQTEDSQLMCCRFDLVHPFRPHFSVTSKTQCGHTESAVAWVTVCKCNQTCCPAGSKTAHGGEMSAKRATSSRE